MVLVALMVITTGCKVLLNQIEQTETFWNQILIIWPGIFNLALLDYSTVIVFFQETTILGMTGFCMLKAKCGCKDIILWEELLGKLNLKLFVYSIPNTKTMYRVKQNTCITFFRFLPYVGWVTIIMTEQPIIKVCFLYQLCSFFTTEYHNANYLINGCSKHTQTHYFVG